MMLSEFVERTGFEPLPFEYEKIEEAYYNFDGDKDASVLQILAYLSLVFKLSSTPAGP